VQGNSGAGSCCVVETFASDECVKDGLVWNETKHGCTAPSKPAPPAGFHLEKYPLARSANTSELDQLCPYNLPVSRACQDLYTLPAGESCVGKLFRVCMMEKPDCGQNDPLCIR
jgi:hypothetical protein